jgi:hypothetical protein
MQILVYSFYVLGKKKELKIIISSRKKKRKKEKKKKEKTRWKSQVGNWKCGLKMRVTKSVLHVL